MLRNKLYTLYSLLYAVVISMMIAACSSTSNLDPDEQLFIGLKHIIYNNDTTTANASTTKDEVEAALACAPNGALFGSSYYRTPIPYGLWIYNEFHDRGGMFNHWLVKTFGTAPVILSDVNPALRSSVATTVLQNYGFFRGSVNYDIIEGKPETTKRDSIPKPRTAKIQYTVNMGPEFHLDSIQYVGFSPDLLTLIRPTGLKKGSAFSISDLEKERKRIYNVFRNNGYYYYNESYVLFLADTLQRATKVQLRVVLCDSLPTEALRRYAIGRTHIQIRNQYGEALTDSTVRRMFVMEYNGGKSPVRARVIFNNMKLRHGNMFSQDVYSQSYNNLTQTGIFSSVDFQFTPRSSNSMEDKSIPEQQVDTLDMLISCVVDKPYDISLSANFNGKTSGRLGPALGLTFSRRNAFRGGEVLSLNLGANYEFQTALQQSTSTNTYDFTGGVSLSIPRLVAPTFITGTHRRWKSTPSTTLSVTGELVNRSGFYMRNILSADITYSFQPTMQSRHQFSPLILEYDHIKHVSADFYAKVLKSPMLFLTLDDHFMPKMRYSYTFTSPTTYLNPIIWNATVTESGNLLALGYWAYGRDFNEKDKWIMNTPFTQFVKFETDFLKSWRTGEKSSFLFHTSFGIMKCYGNSSDAPHSECFYAGGPSSIRAFAAHGIGPGSMYNSDSKSRYITNVGDIKFIMNLEYRPRLFGSLYGALFVDAGNVWTYDNYNTELQSVWQEYGETIKAINEKIKDPGVLSSLSSVTGKDSRFQLKNLPNDIALGVGVGVRYDLDVFVIRLDWGFALHSPYDTGQSGYFNMRNFGKAQTINFAIGYPF